MPRMPDDKALSVTPKYLIGPVTKQTGLSIDVVRVWERRYGAVRPARSDGGTRVYSDADVARLKRLRQAVEKGFGIGQAVRLSESELDEVIGETRRAPEPADPYAAVREKFLDAVETMDVAAAEQELSRAATLFSTRELVMKVIAPMLPETGGRWAREEFGAAHEHLASALIRGLICSLLRLYPPSANAVTIVFTTPARQRQEGWLLLGALLAAMHGWRVVYLGADLPAEEIARAVRLSNAQILILEATAGNARLDDEVRAIASLVPLSARVWIGGSEATKHRTLLDRANWTLVRNLEDLDDRLKK